LLYDKWLELCQLISYITLPDEEDSPVWMYHPTGVYSVKSFYGIVNNVGIILVHTLAIWTLNVPPRIHVFLWLLVNNKTLTRDNLDKRRHVEDRTCVFCAEPESVNHLLFECIVVKCLCNAISSIFYVPLGDDFESVAVWWISNNKKIVLNMFSSAVMWSVWSHRNDLCFQGKSWLAMDVVWNKVAACIGRWRVLCKDSHSSMLDRNLLLLDRMRSELLRIAW
jgi:hypothetical protein